MKFKSEELLRKAENNIKTFFEDKPVILDLLKKLDSEGITYGIFAGSCVCLLTQSREMTDLDIIVADEDSKKMEKSFTFKKVLPGKVVDGDMATDGKSFYLDTEIETELLVKLDLIDKVETHQIRITPLVKKNILELGGLNFMPPEDVMICKSLSQRGKGLGKHDLEDIDALLKVFEVDRDYLRKRVKEIGSHQRIRDLLGKYLS